MGGRNRPRVAPPKEEIDSHEESLYWGKIVNELKNLHSLSIKVDNLEAKITQEEKNAEGMLRMEYNKIVTTSTDESCNDRSYQSRIAASQRTILRSPRSR